MALKATSLNYSDPFGLCPTCENKATLAIQVEGVENRTWGDVAVLGGMAVGAAAGGMGIVAGAKALLGGMGLLRAAQAGGAVAAAGKAAADARMKIPEGHALLAIVKDGRILRQTADITLSHARLVETTFGSSGMPAGTWVGTVGKIGGQINALNSKTIMGNQLPAPGQIQDLMRSTFK